MTPRESATVVLLRDGPAGPEVFMVRRNLASDFVGGAYVFPGGAVDPHDAAPAVVARAGGVPSAHAAERLGLPPTRAIAHYGAAIRETFEEAGVLLARQAGRPIAQADPRWADARRALLARALDWEAFVVGHDLELACDQVAYFAHWITPEGVPKRFTTRFFAALAPHDQAAAPDAQEVDHGVWIRPQDALAAAARREMTLIFPTLKTLEELQAAPSAEAALADARARRVVTRLPRVVQREGQPRPVILLPGDPGYAEAEGLPPVPFDPSILP